MKRSARAGVEDRWHRGPRRGEQVPWPADEPRPGCWCTDSKHGEPGTLVTTARHGQGLRWLARWVDHDGNERSKAFGRKAEARARINAITAALTTGTYADPKRGAALFRTVAEDWFASKGSLKEKTRAGYRSLLDVIVLPQWGDVSLSDVSHTDIQSWVNKLSSDPGSRQRKATSEDAKDKGLSPARVIQAYQVLNQTLRFAARSKYIAANAADHIQLPRKATPEKIALTHEQVRKLAEASGQLATQVYTLAYAGLRYGECAALRVRDVDLQRRRLKVSRSVTAVAKMGLVEGTTKTHQARTVPVPKFVADALARQVKGKAPADLVFPGPRGGWMPLDWFAWRFQKACETMGLDSVTPHTLRHTAGSLALASGASVVTVQKLLGHQSPITTMNVYAHQLPDDFDNLAAAMDSAAELAALDRAEV
jgi:integrase